MENAEMGEAAEAEAETKKSEDGVLLSALQRLEEALDTVCDALPSSSLSTNSMQDQPAHQSVELAARVAALNKRWTSVFGGGTT